VSVPQLFFDHDFAAVFPTIATLTPALNAALPVGSPSVLVLSYEVLANSSIKIKLNDTATLTNIALLTESLEDKLGYPPGSLTVTVNPTTNEVIVTRNDPNHTTNQIRTPAPFPSEWVAQEPSDKPFCFWDCPTSAPRTSFTSMTFVLAAVLAFVLAF
jgi:hypothetical protein